MSNPKNLTMLLLIIFFSTFSTMMIMQNLPTFLFEELKLTVMQISKIDAFAEMFAFTSKGIFSFFSYKLKKNKEFILFGTILSFLMKFSTVFVNKFETIFFIRSFERVAKGIRTAPSDLMIAEFTDSKNNLKYYILRNGTLTFASFFAGYVSFYILKNFKNDIRLVFSVASIPAFIAILVASLLVIYNKKNINDIREKAEFDDNFQTKTENQKTDNFFINEKTNKFFEGISFFKKFFLKRGRKNVYKKENKIEKISFFKKFIFPKKYWLIIFLTILVTMTKFSDSFFTIHLRSVGAPRLMIPIIYAFSSIIIFFSITSVSSILGKIKKINFLLFLMIFVMFSSLIIFSSKSIVSSALAGFILTFCVAGGNAVIIAMIVDSLNGKNIGAGFAIFYIVHGFASFFRNIIFAFFIDFLKKPSGGFLLNFIFSVILIILISSLKNKSILKENN